MRRKESEEWESKSSFRMRIQFPHSFHLYFSTYICSTCISQGETFLPIIIIITIDFSLFTCDSSCFFGSGCAFNSAFNFHPSPQFLHGVCRLLSRHTKNEIIRKISFCILTSYALNGPWILCVYRGKKHKKIFLFRKVKGKHANVELKMEERNAKRIDLFEIWARNVNGIK